MSGHDRLRVTLPEGRSAEQNETMAMLTTQAGLAWKQEKHPGWSAANCGKDGNELLDIFRQQVHLPCTAGFQPSPLLLLMPCCFVIKQGCENTHHVLHAKRVHVSICCKGMRALLFLSLSPRHVSWLLRVQQCCCPHAAQSFLLSLCLL